MCKELYCELWMVVSQNEILFPRLSLSLLLLKQSWNGSVTLYKKETASSFRQTVNLNISMSNCHFSGLLARGEDLRSSGGWCGGQWGCVLGRRSEFRMEEPHQAVDCYRYLVPCLTPVVLTNEPSGGAKKQLWRYSRMYWHRSYE